MEKPVIRKYRPDDFDNCLNVDGRPSERRRGQLVMLLVPGPIYCYVAEYEKFEGWIMMEDLGGDGKSHYMRQINVAQKRKGVGRQLVKRVFEEIGEYGHISLCVNADNKEAIGFYEAMGFTLSGFTAKYRRNQDKLWYQIDL